MRTPLLPCKAVISGPTGTRLQTSYALWPSHLALQPTAFPIRLQPRLVASSLCNFVGCVLWGPTCLLVLFPLCRWGCRPSWFFLASLASSSFGLVTWPCSPLLPGLVAWPCCLALLPGLVCLCYLALFASVAWPWSCPGSCNWSFNEGRTSHAIYGGPSHLYNQAGTYQDQGPTPALYMWDCTSTTKLGPTTSSQARTEEQPPALRPTSRGPGTIPLRLLHPGGTWTLTRKHDCPAAIRRRALGTSLVSLTAHTCYSLYLLISTWSSLTAKAGWLIPQGLMTSCLVPLV